MWRRSMGGGQLVLDNWRYPDMKIWWATPASIFTEFGVEDSSKTG